MCMHKTADALSFQLTALLSAVGCMLTPEVPLQQQCRHSLLCAATEGTHAGTGKGRVLHAVA